MILMVMYCAIPAPIIALMFTILASLAKIADGNSLLTSARLSDWMEQDSPSPYKAIILRKVLWFSRIKISEKNPVTNNPRMIQ